MNPNTRIIISTFVSLCSASVNKQSVEFICFCRETKCQQIQPERHKSASYIQTWSVCVETIDRRDSRLLPVNSSWGSRMVQGRRSFFLFSAHLYIYTCLHVRSVFFFPHQSRGFSVLDGTSSAVVAAAARPASSPQVVPELNEGLTVLPDQLVTEQDVPDSKHGSS